MLKGAELTIGAAQLGMDYGVANRAGKPGLERALDFLATGIAAGVSSIDTSPGYGESEAVIGEFIRRSRVPLRITSKLPPVSADGIGTSDHLKKQVRGHLVGSLNRLGVERIENYLIHSEAEFLTQPEALLEALRCCQDDDLAERVGVSVYSTDGAKRAIDLGYDVVQLPCNLFDQRFDQAGIFDLAQRAGVMIQTRSVFLQGLFFLKKREVEKWLPQAVPHLETFATLVAFSGRSASEVALAYVRDKPGIANLVVGMDNEVQLEENLRLMKSVPLSDELRDSIKEAFSAVAEVVVNPSQWKRG